MNSDSKETILASDGFKLRGFLHLPKQDEPLLEIGGHGLFGNADSPKQIVEASL